SDRMGGAKGLPGGVRAPSGPQGRDRRTLPAELSAEVVRGLPEVRLDGPSEAIGRRRRPAGTHVDVDLAGLAASGPVVPEVDVFLALHRLHPEATTDLHASRMKLPLLKGNHQVDESCVPVVHMPPSARPAGLPLPPLRPS